MKKAIVIGLAVVLGIGLIGYAVADPDHGQGRGMGYGWMQQGRSGGPGWMHRGWGRTRGMGPGWMGRMGPGYGPGFGPCQEAGKVTAGEKLTKEKAESIVKRRLAFLGNPNLKVGSVKEESGGFVAEIVTKDDSLVDRLRIDKETGFIQPIR
ncbi:MAG: hypothetical protein QGG90_12855 [Nitrospinota bacterium]|nr:hypothetical protein [Nitrospinota bacterium]